LFPALKQQKGIASFISDRLTKRVEAGHRRHFERVREETGYTVALTGFVGVYSALKRDPRFRAVSIAYKGTIIGGVEHGSGEGKTCWRTPTEVFGHMAFDCENMLKDYLSDQQRLS